MKIFEHSSEAAPISVDDLGVTSSLQLPIAAAVWPFAKMSDSVVAHMSKPVNTLRR